MECKPIFEYLIFNNCNNNCQFCFQRYHNHKGKILNDEQKVDSIHKVINHLETKFKKGSHVLIVGGELFDTKLSQQAEHALLGLIDKLLLMQENNEIDLLYVNTNLIYEDTTYLEYLLKEVINHNLQDRLRFTTSYDIYGRYKDESARQLFLKNLAMIRDCYPQIHTVVNMIMTKQFCEAVLSGALNVRAFKNEYKVNVNTIPYIILREEMAADRDQIFRTLMQLDAQMPGYLKAYIDNIALPQKKLLYEYNNGELVYMSSKDASCGHNENFHRYVVSRDHCFVCDMLSLGEVLNV